MKHSSMQGELGETSIPERHATGPLRLPSSLLCLRHMLRPWLAAFVVVGLWGPSLAAICQHEETPFLIAKEQVWRYFAGKPQPPKDWKSLSFDDANWKSGRAGFGYGDSDDVTVLEDMRDAYTAVYIRKSFEIERPDQVDTLYLYVNYDDGFIAYLNGKDVASSSMKRTSSGVLVDQHEAEGFEEFVIRDAGSLLKPGNNVLAIEGHNVALDSSDFSLDPLLATRRISVFNTVAD